MYSGGAVEECRNSLVGETLDSSFQCQKEKNNNGRRKESKIAILRMATWWGFFVSNMFWFFIKALWGR